MSGIPKSRLKFLLVKIVTHNVDDILKNNYVSVFDKNTKRRSVNNAHKVDYFKVNDSKNIDLLRLLL